MFDTGSDTTFMVSRRMKIVLMLMLVPVVTLAMLGLNATLNPTECGPTTLIPGTPALIPATPAATGPTTALISESTTASSPKCSAVVVDASHRAAVDAVAKQVQAAKLTMTSTERLANAGWCVLDIIERGLQGAIVETGVWRGGVSMVMRKATLVTNTDSCHESWLFDSYEGLPAENAVDKSASAGWAGKEHAEMDPAGSYAFKGGVETVKRDVQKIVGGNTDTIHYVKGWFQDTVFKAPISEIAVLRLDGDMYTSTMDVLHAFYDKVVPTGYVVIDDYGHWPQCKKAIHDYFEKEKKMNITALLKKVDYTGYYFQKPA